MRLTKTTVKATVSVVINITSAFTPVVTDFPTATKAKGNSTPDDLLLVKSFETEEDTAAIISSLVGKRFACNPQKTE